EGLSLNVLRVFTRGVWLNLRVKLVGLAAARGEYIVKLFAEHPGFRLVRRQSQFDLDRLAGADVEPVTGRGLGPHQLRIDGVADAVDHVIVNPVLDVSR